MVKLLKGNVVHTTRKIGNRFQKEEVTKKKDSLHQNIMRHEPYGRT